MRMERNRSGGASMGSPFCKLRVQTSRTCTQVRANPFGWGVCFFGVAEKTYALKLRGQHGAHCGGNVVRTDTTGVELFL
jgi:hypothetical protein